MTIILLQTFSQIEKRVKHLARILSRCLLIPMRCRWSSVFHSISTVTLELLNSGELLNHSKSFFPCNVWLLVLVHLSKTQYRIWEYADIVSARDWRLLHHQPMINTSMKSVCSYLYFPWISSDCSVINFSDMSNFCFIVRSSVFLMECKLPE